MTTQTAPIDALDEMAARHVRHDEVWADGERLDSGDYCSADHQQWPCDASILLDRVKRLQFVIDVAADPHAVSCETGIWDTCTCVLKGTAP